MKARILLAVLSLALLAGCSGQKAQAPADQSAASTSGFKIGLMTGTVSQSEDEFRAGQQIGEEVRRTASSTSPTPTTSCRSRRP